MKKIIVIIFLIVSSSVLLYGQTNGLELDRIEFNGNDHFSTSVLKEVILSQESPGWFWKFLNSFTSFGKEIIFFDSLNITQDIRALNEFYVTNGYFNTKIEYSYNLDTVNSIAVLIFDINENEPANFRNINYFGLGELNQHDLGYIYEYSTFDSNIRFNQEIVKENISFILSYLLNNGYMNVAFDSTIITKDTVHNKADIDLYISTGKQYKISEVQVSTQGVGSPDVKDELLQTLTAINRDDIYNYDKIRRSQVRLYRTGLFSNVSINTLIADTVNNYVPLQVSGSIGNMNELAPELIINNQSGAFLFGIGGSYTRKNFLGGARKLSLNGIAALQDIFNTSFSNFFNRISLKDTTLFGVAGVKLSLEQPFLFNRPILGRFEIYTQIEKLMSISSQIRSGGLLSFEFEMPSHTFITYLRTYYNLEVIQAIDAFDFEDPDVDQYLSEITSIIGVDIRSSKTDNLIFPTSGHNLFLFLEEGNLIPYLFARAFKKETDQVLFYKALATYAMYFATNKRRSAVLGFKNRIGYIHPYHNEADLYVPINRTLYAGGSNSVRGWRFRELSPSVSDVAPEIVPYFGNFKIGGYFLFEGSVEWRYKLSDNFGTALFFDYGNVWLNKNNFRFDEIALAAGIGFRYYTSFAPFRIDFGFKAFDPYSDEKILNRKFFDIFEFHFGVGESF